MYICIYIYCRASQTGHAPRVPVVVPVVVVVVVVVVAAVVVVDDGGDALRAPKSCQFLKAFRTKHAINL